MRDAQVHRGRPQYQAGRRSLASAAARKRRDQRRPGKSAASAQVWLLRTRSSFVRSGGRGWCLVNIHRRADVANSFLTGRVSAPRLITLLARDIFRVPPFFEEVVQRARGGRSGGGSSRRCTKWTKRTAGDVIPVTDDAAGVELKQPA